METVGNGQRYRIYPIDNGQQATLKLGMSGRGITTT